MSIVKLCLGYFGWRSCIRAVPDLCRHVYENEFARMLTEVDRNRRKLVFNVSRVYTVMVETRLDLRMLNTTCFERLYPH